MAKVVNTRWFQFFVSDQKADLLQNKINQLMTVINLLDYSIKYYPIDKSNDIKIHYISLEKDLNLINIKFNVHPKTNRLKSIEISIYENQIRIENSSEYHNFSSFIERILQFI